jgi:C-terminal processing protease CtpA/Prc
VKIRVTFMAFTILLVLSSLALVTAQEAADVPRAEIVNDEGGPVVLTGSVTYTNILFTDGVSEPLIILEDQAGFVDRNENYRFPRSSQVLGQITSDFFTSPFTYSLALPFEPQGTLRDVDHDGQDETGVMIFAVAYWNNVFGDSLLEERDQYGGGWSTAYASTRISQEIETENEVIGGKYLVYASDDQQGFPSGFGEDGLLFTEDDPIVLLPQGYTVVSMDTDPFTFDRTREQVIDLIEPEGAALEDYSALSYPEAFDAMVALMRVEYAFTNEKNVDWDALIEEFRPRFEQADADSSSLDYQQALWDFFKTIPDGHMGFPIFPQLTALFRFETDGGLGIAVRQLDDGRVLVNYVLEGSPAAEAGIELRAEILAINGTPIEEALDAIVPWSAPFSTEHVLRLQQLRYVTRFPVDTEVEVTYQNPGDEELTTTTLTAIAERDSFAFSSFNVGLSGVELPVEFSILDSGYGYVKIYSFQDDDRFEVLLWERMIRTFNSQNVPGVIIDMRQNGGGSSFLANQMAAYFFDEPVELGNTNSYDDRRGEFYTDPRYVQTLYLPPEELRYRSQVAVLVGPNCNSACELFTRTMTLNRRTEVVGHYPTAGLGGGQHRFLMPEVGILQFSASRFIDMEGNLLIEGVGVLPKVRVPVSEETLFAEGDVLLNAATTKLDELTAVNMVEAGSIAVGETVTGEIPEMTAVRYLLEVKQGQIIDITLSTDQADLDVVLSLYLEDGETLVGQADSGGGGETESAEDLEIPIDLTLILEVSGFEGGTGPFTLSVAESSGAAPEATDNP